MDVDSSSVYMCFPCYQEFNTLEEVLTHQMTCTAEAVAPPVATDETATMSLPTLQTEELITQADASLTAHQAQSVVSLVYPVSSASIQAAESPRKPSLSDQPRILYQCGDCNALFNALHMWQKHRKEGLCLQDKTQPDQDPGPDLETFETQPGSEMVPEGNAEAETALEPDGERQLTEEGAEIETQQQNTGEPVAGEEHLEGQNMDATPSEAMLAAPEDPCQTDAPPQDPSAPDPEPEDGSTPRRRGALKKIKPPSSLLCVDCGACFALVSELVSHRKAQHGLEEALHRCTVCGESFLNTTLFLYHRKQHRQLGEERPRDGTKEAPDQTAHMQENPPVQEEVVEESIADFEGVSGIQSNGTEGQCVDAPSAPAPTLLCAECGNACSSEEELSAHRAREHGLEKALHLCSQCGLSFMNTTQYLYHRRQHRAAPPTRPEDTGEGVTATTTTPVTIQSTQKRMLSKRPTPTIRILSMNTLKEANSAKSVANEELEDRLATEGEPPGQPPPPDASNLPAPAKLLQDWSRTPLPHVCPHCGKTFTRRVFLRAHVFSHTGEKLFTCKVCNKSFASSPNLLRHSLTHMGTKPYPCPVCGKRFAQAGTLKRHALTHSQAQDAKRRRRARVTQRGPEEGDGGFKLFSCPNCTARFQTEEQLQDHRLLHTSHPFPCSVCGMAFKRRKELDLHSLSHQDKEPASCPHCWAQFVNQSVLDIHLQRCPETEENKSLGRGRGQGRGRSTGQMECDLCGHRCMTQEGLDLHRLSHTGQTPLKCPLSPCRRRFASSSALAEHVLAHCQGTLAKGRTARRFHCQICGKDFAYTSTFNVHMRIHTDERPFGCPTCGKRFRQLPHLQDHERIHSGLRPFCCWVCGKSFSVAARLTEHARIHSGEKPYPCPRCPSSFRSRSNYDKHMRTHGVDPDAADAAITDAEMTEGARVLTTLAGGGDGEGAYQTILLVQSGGEGGTTEQVVIPTLSGEQQASGTITSQGVYLHPSMGGQTISLPSLAGLMEGQDVPSVIVVEGQDLPHSFEFIVEETV
ncbi:zinc finger protein 574 isoform X1 [Hypomesus transpacificus]|uniref:zinc finger protein 574 isoform X1 n=1 Tax=Hypomesus transpacificus TaxID=137520 RepID=UPI001F08196A|nr:zinc finger protein 574 isoform X1 [Hypomesus transpacificus]XP_046893777.1 zinc finger protein 574 isoform X1 [Hypomesus transpacificus]